MLGSPGLAPEMTFPPYIRNKWTNTCTYIAKGLNITCGVYEGDKSLIFKISYFIWEGKEKKELLLIRMKRSLYAKIVFFLISSRDYKIIRKSCTSMQAHL